MTALDFHIDARDAAARKLHVTLEFDRGVFGVEEAGQLFLPTWTPGSYLVREYARHLGRVRAIAVETGEELPCAKATKNRFRVDLSGVATGRIRVTYSIHAHEFTVRTSDLTEAHAFWNNACVLLWPVDRPGLDCRLDVSMPDGWEGVSGLPATAPAKGDAAWSATDLAHAMDGPCLLGRFQRLEFEVRGVPHLAVFDGLGGLTPPATFAADLTAIIEAAADVFGGTLPYDEYTFLCLFADEGYGGLEHRNSTTLLLRRTALSDTDGYREFLALCAHELFHVWNIKRMRPTEFWNYDYENETYSSMLWLAEGWTAYYDDLLCLRAGHFTVEHYLEVAAKNIRQMLTGAGRLNLSLAESSFDAWIRLYRPDENTRNASQNYYVNGAVAAMSLDLLVRHETAGARCLDDVIRELYSSTFGEGRGYTAEDVFSVIERIAGSDAAALMRQMTKGVLDPPLESLLTNCGVRYTVENGQQPHLGITFAAASTRIASVPDDSPAARGGLHPGDEIVALQGLRVTDGSWREVFRSTAAIGQALDVMIARRGVMMTVPVTPSTGAITVKLEVDQQADKDRASLRAGWLHSARPATTATTPAAPARAAKPVGG